MKRKEGSSTENIRTPRKPKVWQALIPIYVLIVALFIAIVFLILAHTYH